MNHECEQNRASSPAAATPHNYAVEPGQSSRSASLRKPERAIASGLVQRKARDASGEQLSDHIAQDVHQIAARGMSGTASALPHLETIQRSFGSSHDLSGVRAYVGGDAAQAAASMGAKAYTAGNQIAFATSPDLALAAHEAAHVIQQRGGVQLKGGVGQVGDPYEQHADAVAARVVRGESAVDLLGSQYGAPEVQHGPTQEAACSECGSVPAGAGDCPACKATQSLEVLQPALPTQTAASAVQRQACDSSVSSCPFEDPDASSASASSEPNMSGEPNASVVPPAGNQTSAPRYPNQTCTNEVLDALQAAMHAACDLGQSTCNPNKVSQKKLDRLSCQKEAVRLLLDAGADVNVVGGEGDSPLRWAAQAGDTEMVRLLLEHGATQDLDVGGGVSGMNALGVAAHRLDVAMVRLLLEAGARPEAPDADGWVASHRADRPDDAEALERWRQVMSLLGTPPTS